MQRSARVWKLSWRGGSAEGAPATLLLGALVACVTLHVACGSPVTPADPTTTAAITTAPAVCAVGNATYRAGQEVPGAARRACERCVCGEAGAVSCRRRPCEQRPGCKAVHRPDECCPTYQCECSQDGRVYGNGEKLVDPADPCKVCYCQGGEVVCRRIACFLRSDCEPRLVPGRCCPEYDHCPLRGISTESGGPSTFTASLTPATATNISNDNVKKEITIKEVTPVSEIPAIAGSVRIKETVLTPPRSSPGTAGEYPPPPSSPGFAGDHAAGKLPEEDDPASDVVNPAFPPLPDDLSEPMHDDSEPQVFLATPDTTPSPNVVSIRTSPLINLDAALSTEILDTEVSEPSTSDVTHTPEDDVHEAPVQPAPQSMVTTGSESIISSSLPQRTTTSPASLDTALRSRTDPVSVTADSVSPSVIGTAQTTNIPNRDSVPLSASSTSPTSGTDPPVSNVAQLNSSVLRSSDSSHSKSSQSPPHTSPIPLNTSSPATITSPPAPERISSEADNPAVTTGRPQSPSFTSPSSISAPHGTVSTLLDNASNRSLSKSKASSSPPPISISAEHVTFSAVSTSLATVNSSSSLPSIRSAQPTGSPNSTTSVQPESNPASNAPGNVHLKSSVTDPTAEPIVDDPSTIAPIFEELVTEVSGGGRRSGALIASSSATNNVLSDLIKLVGDVASIGDRKAPPLVERHMEISEEESDEVSDLPGGVEPTTRLPIIDREPSVSPTETSAPRTDVELIKTGPVAGRRPKPHKLVDSQDSRGLGAPPPAEAVSRGSQSDE